jgi:hypothetical protein
VDAVVVKYSPSGSGLWAQRVGSSGFDGFSAVAIDSTDNVVAAGHYTGTPTGVSGIAAATGDDALIVKYSGSTGSYQWAQRLGGAGWDRFFSLAVNSAGQVLAVGTYSGAVTGSNVPGSTPAVIDTIPAITDQGAMILLYDSLGQYSWSYGYGGGSAQKVSLKDNSVWLAGSVDGASQPLGDTRVFGQYAAGWSGPALTTTPKGTAKSFAWSGSAATTGAVALGTAAYASGTGSVALGQATAGNVNAFAVGQAKATGAGSIALGTSVASADSAVAIGDGNTASGYGATAFGIGTSASEYAATALGCYTFATGYAAVALGEFSLASGYTALASGMNAIASGTGAAALGNYVVASGNAAAAFGEYTVAQAYGSVAFGFYNVAQGEPTGPVSTDDLLVLGNGASDAERSNALVVHKNGNTRAAGTVEAKGGFRTPPMGDIGMGDFVAGPSPAGLDAGLRYAE